MAKIAILGGGNGAHAAAADFTLRGHDVVLFEQDRFKNNMAEVFETKKIKVSGIFDDVTVDIQDVTSDIDKALDGASHIFVIVPAFAHEAYAKMIAPKLTKGQTVVVLPGTFGSLIFWKEILKEGKENDVVVCESHTLPYATRMAGPGHSIIMSRFNPLKVGVMPANKTDETIKGLGDFYDGVEAVESVIACGLSSLNPIIHVPGCVLNAGRIEVAKGEFWFYTEGFSDVVVRTTEQLDNERIAMLDALGYKSDIVARGIGGAVKSDNLKEVIAGNENFAQIKGPSDFKNRYFSEDIPYGIATWAKLAKSLNIKTPIMDSMVTLGSVILEEDAWENGVSIEDLGIEGMDTQTLLEYLKTGKKA